MKSQYAVILFRSSNHALRAEKIMLGAGRRCKLIPVPRQISSDCGVCLRIAADEVPAVREFLDRRRVEYEEVLAIEP
jgi:hypothetical protein